MHCARDLMQCWRQVNVYPLESYKIGQKEERSEKDPSSAARFERMEATYELEGIRRLHVNDRDNLDNKNEHQNLHR